ncbi:MAG: thiosulfate sulfurtransferase [Armatimonadetes bacterium]|nr:thiosulfate sulfurtransferase [Armatimonadota bacterium]
MDIPELEVGQAAHRLAAGDAIFVDVRDDLSYETSHIPGAIHVDDFRVDEFVASTDKSRALVVYCYHGHNSLGGAAYFLDKGFREVYSLSGGFEEWRLTEAVVSGSQAT